ncbi:MAG TPA: thiol reductant ABC exporter subunit CydD [Bacillota bacterium]
MKRKKGLPSYPGSRLLHVVLSILIVLESIAIIAQATFLARAITLLFERTPISNVFTEITFFFISFVIRYSLQHLQTYIAENYAEKTTSRLRNSLVKAYFLSRNRFVQSAGTGRLVTLAMEGIDDLKKYLEIISIRMLRTGIVPLAIVIYVYTHDSISAIIMIVTVPIVIIFMILLGYAAEKMADKQYDRYQVLSNHFIDSLKGLETLKYLGRSAAHAKSIRRVSKQYRQATMRTLRVAFLSSFALQFFTSLSIAFVAVSLGLRLIDGTISLLPALTILILVPEYFSPIQEVGSDYHATLDGQVAAKEIDAMIKQEAKRQKPTSHEVTWTPSSILQLKGIDVESEKATLLKDISFTWKGSGMIGIVGESGAGKSTLIHVLTGLIDPKGGSIHIDGKNRKTLKSEQWFQNIAYIPQHPYIFPASLADNIRFYVPDASDEEVKRVIKEIDLDVFVQQLPNGIHEKIGEGGRTLSGGQEQRVAMARVLLSKKPIIILDEPTAHLDIETEYEVKQVMMRVFQQKLVLFATHRLHWMKSMDHLLVLDNGRIVEQGTHQELLSKKGTYDEMHKKGGYGNE